MHLRAIPASLLAFAITTSLFYVMTLLVHVPDMEIPPTPRTVVHIVNVMKARPAPPPPPREIIKPTIEREPYTPPSDFDPGKNGRLEIYQGPGPGIAPTHGLGPIGPGVSDGDAIPMVRVTPSYPDRALRRGLSGRVLVAFDLDRAGNVKNARVLAADPPNVFEDAALRAVAQWRYSPKVVNGRAVERQGMKISIPFVLGDR